jgi:predicted ATP-grasp superfamily ATP-dependent carboligase
VIIGPSSVAIEINPRLTTSYIGLRKLSQCNLMDTLIRVVDANEFAEPTWRVDDVSFSSEGQVSCASSMRR